MLSIEPDQLKDLLQERRTIHQFRAGELPPRGMIIDAIDAARWAPNHHLTEPWHFYLLGPETIREIVALNTDIVKMNKGDKVAAIKQERWSAIPGWMVLTCDRSEDPLRSREDFAACCCAAQNMMLYLYNAGIGVKWTTGDVIRDPRFYDLIWVDPAAEEVVGLFWYGYANDIPAASRKSAGQLIVELP